MRYAIRMVLGLVFALAILVPAHPPVEAAIDWCDGDPVVSVTLAGRLYVLHATNGVPRENMPQIDLPTIRVVSSLVVGTQAVVAVELTPRLKTQGNGLLRRDPNFPVRYRLSLPAQQTSTDWIYGVPEAPMVQTLVFDLR